MSPAYIGIDIGTTTITGLIYDLNRREVVHRITANQDSAALHGQENWERLQDANAIYGQTERILEELLQLNPGVEGIGLTGQMHGIVYVNELGEAVSPLYTWQDGRGAQTVPGESRTYAERISELTGYRVAPGYGLATHDYNADHGLLPAGAAALCSIADFVAAKLAGRRLPVMDATQAAAIGGYSAELGDCRAETGEDFDREALRMAGLDTAMLPSVVPSGTKLGHTRQGIPVYASLGDNQASFLGSVPDPEDTLLLNIGTGSQLSAYVPQLTQAPEGMEARPYPGGGVLMVGAALSGGKAYALLEMFFQEVIEAYTGKPLEANEVYAWMERLMRQAPEQEQGLSVRPWFLGTRSDPNVRGSIENISLDNFKPASLAHALLKGMVEELHAFALKLLAAKPANYRRLVGSGNALRSNPVLCAKAEEVFGMPMQLSASPEEAAVGAALCAAVGGGRIESFQRAGRFVAALKAAD
ncbi:sedoheptulokinase [Paenibacillus physcomitrellae]|uniref:Xylulose kinase n=1 Tax=Paenibacillus physcomitrellae TaxID=1619311 RepID=A0ABQ1FPP1_9BACL|nr:FGGY family carbohydrate kinase [Paenibacillus physcomitrellae]GGA25505.1 xylulose kinase [Paenibacillus physcomitrellae]